MTLYSKFLVSNSALDILLPMHRRAQCNACNLYSNLSGLNLGPDTIFSVLCGTQHWNLSPSPSLHLSFSSSNVYVHVIRLLTEYSDNGPRITKDPTELIAEL